MVPNHADHRENDLTFAVGVVQATPAYMNLEDSLVIVEEYTRQAAERACRLVLFPESFLPGYPRGMDFGVSVGHRSDQGRKLWQDYWEHSVTVGDKTTGALADIARTHQLILCMGITERDPVNGSLYCSMIIHDEQRRLIHHHRKIKPTGSERIIWAEGDGNSIRGISSTIGRLGGLICWENLIPMARVALYESGIDIYLAPTADGRESWTAIMQHIALESRSYVMSANQYFRLEDYPTHYRNHLSHDAAPTSPGGSLIISPLGQIVAGPVYGQESLLVADIDMGEVIRARMDFDPVGHYARPDLFTLTRRLLK